MALLLCAGEGRILYHLIVKSTAVCVFMNWQDLMSLWKTGKMHISLLSHLFWLLLLCC